MNYRPVYVCVDREMINNELEGLSGIGLCVLDATSYRIIFKKRWWIKFDNNKMDPRCKKEFWDKNIEIYEEMISEGKDMETQIKDFVKEWDRLEKEYPNMKLVSDNPGVDFDGWSYLLWKYAEKKYPLRFTNEGKYRSITDLGDVAWYLGLSKIIESEASLIVKHTHRPDEDAENTIIQTLMMDRLNELIKNQLFTGYFLPNFEERVIYEVQTLRQHILMARSV